jgi:hypothetical protein
VRTNNFIILKNPDQVALYIDKPLYYQAKVHPVIIYISTSYEYF